MPRCHQRGRATSEGLSISHGSGNSTVGRERGWTFGAWASLVFLAGGICLSMGTSGEQAKPDTGFTDREDVAVAPPPLSSDTFPCSDCHDPENEVDRTHRVVEDHPEIVLAHGGENRWCLDCHDAQNRDKLHLTDGTLLDFTESYRLCGQCHGPKLRDWKAGDHGKRTGSWSGRKEYLLCAHCHDPHTPRFKPIAPEPPPVPQEMIRWTRTRQPSETMRGP